jgi:hypothetical protein
MAIKSFSVDMQAIGGIFQTGDGKENPLVELQEGQIDLRVLPCPKTDGIPEGTYLWGVVERFPNGHEQILIGGAKSSLLEASITGATALENIIRNR